MFIIFFAFRSAGHFLYLQLQMKRFLIVIFALLYIGLSSGITLTLHHCMGKLVEVNMWQDETCNTCGAKHTHKSCYSTETQFIKISDDQNVDQLQVIKHVPVAIALLFDLRDLYNLTETEQGTTLPACADTPSEWSGTDRLIRHCTFLI